MQLRKNILKIKYTLALIFSVLVMLFGYECYSKPIDKETLDSLKALEGTITIIDTNKVVNKSKTELQNDSIINSSLTIQNQRVDGVFVDCDSGRNHKLYSGYFLLLNRRTSYSQMCNGFEKSIGEVIMEMDKIHLKGKVGVLDNLVPIQWIQ